MKVVFASGTYPPELGGMATFVAKTARGLVRRGIKVGVVAYARRKQVLSEEYPVTLVARGYSAIGRYIAYFFSLRRMALDCDLIYAQDLISSGLPAAMVSVWLGKKLVLRLGGDFLWEKRVEMKKTTVPLREYFAEYKTFVERFYLMLYSWVLRRASLIIFNTELQQDLYRKYFPVTQSKNVVIHNTYSFTPKVRQTVQPRLVYAGRFIRLKNLEFLLQAYQRVAVESKLVLIGEGPQYHRLVAYASDLELFDRLEILPPMKRADLIHYIQESYLVIVPSLTELNPNIVLEALSVGTPALVTRENGLPAQVRQYVREFNPTLLSSLANALQDALDPSHYEAWITRLQKARESLTSDQIVARHLQVFGDLLK